MVKFPHDVTLTLQQVKFPEETPDTTNRVIYPGNFMLTRFRVKFTLIYLRNYVLGVFQVTLHTMRCACGSINKILLEWDPRPTYLVQRLWDPGGSNHSSTYRIWWRLSTNPRFLAFFFDIISYLVEYWYVLLL